MRFIAVIATVAMTVLGASVAQAACTAPPKPSPTPDGESASKSDVMAAVKQLKALDAATQKYIDCMYDEALASSGDKADKKTKKRLEKAEDKALKRLEDAQKDLNAQIRAYNEKRAKNKEKSG